MPLDGRVALLLLLLIVGVVFTLGLVVVDELTELLLPLLLLLGLLIVLEFEFKDDDARLVVV